MPKKFKVKDSGKRMDYPSGMRRDIQTDKPRYDLVYVPMLTRWANLMMSGAVKYGEDNWKLANSKAELIRFRASAFRHFIQWFTKVEDGEDHAAAVFFNISCVEYLKNEKKVKK